MRTGGIRSHRSGTARSSCCCRAAPSRSGRWAPRRKRPAGATPCRPKSVPFSSRRSRRGRYCFPAAGTLRHVGVVTARLLAVVPHALLLGGGLAALDIDGRRSRCDRDRVLRRGGVVVRLRRVVGRRPITWKYADE